MAGVEIAIGLASFDSEFQVYAYKPYLQPGSVYQDGRYWMGVDPFDGKTYIVAKVGTGLLDAQGAAANAAEAKMRLQRIGQATPSLSDTTRADGTTAKSPLINFLPGLGMLQGTADLKKLLIILLIGASVVLVLNNGRAR